MKSKTFLLYLLEFDASANLALGAEKFVYLGWYIQELCKNYSLALKGSQKFSNKGNLSEIRVLPELGYMYLTDKYIHDHPLCG